jgi:hypothetical protein
MLESNIEIPDVAEGRTGTWIEESMIETKKEIQKPLG